MSRLPAGNAEEGTHSILEKHNLSLPVPLKPLDHESLEGYPRLRPLDFLQYMKDSGNLHRLLGGRQVSNARPFLEAFWKAYEVCHPDFSLYLQEGVDYGTCIPIYVHADGGRGYKKSEFMVFNWSAALGSGTGRLNRKDHEIRSFKRARREKESQINLLGHTYGTHYLYAVMPQAWHKDDSMFQAMMDCFGKDLAECYEVGIEYDHQRLRLVPLGLKADLKLQARAGRFTRWYTTCRKSAYDPAKRNQTAGYCCWLCPAGHIDYPFEEVNTESPAWLKEMASFACVAPWRDGQVNGLIRCGGFSYLAHPAKYYLPDLFHIYLAGFGQDFAGGALVYMLGITFPGSSVDQQLESLNGAWRRWKKMYKIYAHTYYFARPLLNFGDASKMYPTGTWSKASDTAKIIRFIKYMCELYEDVLPHDKVLYYIHVASTALGVCMRSLYDSDLWIESWCIMRFCQFSVS